jgi:hypothetical protein
MKIGQRVRAVEKLTEENFAGKALHVHAERGDVGEVVHVDQHWVTVRFDGSGTAYSCAPEEVRAAEREAA